MDQWRCFSLKSSLCCFVLPGRVIGNHSGSNGDRARFKLTSGLVSGVGTLLSGGDSIRLCSKLRFGDDPAGVNVLGGDSFSGVELRFWRAIPPSPLSFSMPYRSGGFLVRTRPKATAASLTSSAGCACSSCSSSTCAAGCFTIHFSRRGRFFFLCSCRVVSGKMGSASASPTSPRSMPSICSGVWTGCSGTALSCRCGSWIHPSKSSSSSGSTSTGLHSWRGGGAGGGCWWPTSLGRSFWNPGLL